MAKKKNWIGKSFLEWCQEDPNDERKINYHISGIWEGKKQETTFTSEDILHPEWLIRLQNSTIKGIELKNGEWYADLVY